MRVVRRARFGFELQRLSGKPQPEALHQLRDALWVDLEPIAGCEVAQNGWLEARGASKFYQFTKVPPLNDIAVFVLARVSMEWGGQCACRHRMLNQREAAPGLAAVNHEPHTDASEKTGQTICRSQNSVMFHALYPLFDAG